MRQLLGQCFFLSIFLFAALVPLGVRASDKPILFVMEGCGHCDKVEAYIHKYNLDGEVIVRDVTRDPVASEEYTEFLENAGVPLERRGVPVLAYGETEFETGDTPIISYLSDRYGVVEKNNAEDFDSGDFAVLGFGGIIALAIVGYGIVKAVHDKKSR